MRLIHRLALCCIFLLPGLAMAAPGQRVALLIGNAKYTSAPLTNPPSDVRHMEAALKKVGFKVQTLLDANQNQMKRALRDFGDAAQGAEVAFLYYSGHGTQAGGENYLIPIQASISKESDYEIEAVGANSLMRQIAGARPRAAIVVLDACRDNPFASATKSTTKGLGRMDAPTGSMIAFATAPNTTASDEGLYARELARQISTPGVELYDVFRNTTAEVQRQSKGRQVPRVSEVSITEKIYLAGSMPATGPGTQLATAKPEPAGRPVLSDPEDDAWQAAKAANTLRGYDAYLSEHPKGRYAGSARVAREAIAVPKGFRIGYVDADRFRKALGQGSGPEDLSKLNLKVAAFAKKYRFGLILQEVVYTDSDVTDWLIKSESTELNDSVFQSFAEVGLAIRYVNTQRITAESKPAKAAKARLEREFTGHEKEAGFKEKLDKRRNEELQKVLDLANQAVKQVARLGGHSTVLQDAVYVDPALDVTDSLLDLLN